MNINIDKAFTAAIMGVGGIDIIHDGGAYSIWNGSSYDSQKGTYSQEARTPSVEIKTFQTIRKAYSLNDTDAINGYFQIITRYPSQTGQYAAKNKAIEFMTALPSGGSLVYSGVTVNITSSEVISSGSVDGFYQVVSTAKFTAYVNRL